MLQFIDSKKYCPHTIIARFDNIDVHRQDFGASTFSKYCQVIYKGVLANEVEHVQNAINHVQSIKLIMDDAMKCIVTGKKKKATSVTEYVRHITHEFRTRVVKGKIKIKYKISGIMFKENIHFEDNKCIFVINNKFDIISQNKLATDTFGDYVNIYNNNKPGYQLFNNLFDTESVDFQDIKDAIAYTTQFNNNKVRLMNRSINVGGSPSLIDSIMNTNFNFLDDYNNSKTDLNSVIDLMSFKFVHNNVALVRVFPIDNTTSILSIEEIHQRQLKYNRLVTSTLNIVSSILPIHVVKYIANGKNIKDMSSLTRTHNNVSILFTDIKGWTNICDAVEPFKLYSFLNELYSMYDDLANKYNIYKLETVGDCYVAVAGLMRPCENGMVELEEEYDPQAIHNLVAFAKEMIEKVKTIKGPRGYPVAIRVGIHIGSVNSGVIGYKMPKFVLTGDAMNVASRLEQSCNPGSIHVSAEVIDRLCPITTGFVPRGAIEVKGKGIMNTFIYVQGVECVKDVKDKDILFHSLETELSLDMV